MKIHLETKMAMGITALTVAQLYALFFVAYKGGEWLPNWVHYPTIGIMFVVFLLLAVLSCGGWISVMERWRGK